MMIAADVGTTFQLGRYTVRIGLRHDNPAFGRYLIFRGDKLIGAQFSRPCQSDCEWLEQNRVYATATRTVEMFLIAGVRDAAALDDQRNRGGQATRRRGRPRKDQSLRELQEAISS